MPTNFAFFKKPLDKFFYKFDKKAKRNKFASKRTLDYVRKKYPEYANNWLVSQIAVRAETVNVTAHLVGCNT